MFKKASTTILFLFYFLGALSVSAQVRETDITLSISPINPKISQNVTASLNSYVLELDRAFITWYLNGQESGYGVGKKSISFQMPDGPVNLNAIIETTDGKSLSKGLKISAGEVDLLWQAYDAYTPPFYKGKALAPSQGTFKVVALPNASNNNGQIDQNNFSYQWEKDGSIQTNASGWGKSYFIFKNSYLDKNNQVGVKVSDIMGGINLVDKITLQTFKPKILFYKKNTETGDIWNKTLENGTNINTAGEIIIAEPYFFSPKDFSNLSFNWFINNGKINTPESKNTLYIKPEEGKSGSASIKLSIENTATLFQSGENKLEVQF